MNTKDIKKLKFKFLLSTWFIVTIIAGARLYDDLNRTKVELENKKSSILKQINFFYKNELAEIKNSFLVRGEYILKNNNFIEAIKSKNREKLYNLIKMRFDTLKKDYPFFKIMHFHLSDHTTLLRVHKPEAYGDNLKEKRPMIAKAINSRKVQTGLETGLHDMECTTYRVALPIFDDNEFLGVLELGIDLKYILKKTKKFFREINEDDLEIEFLLHQGHTKYHKEHIMHKKFGNYEFVCKNKFFTKIVDKLNFSDEIKQIDIEGKDYLITWNNIKLKDYKSKKIGTIIYAFSITNLINERNDIAIKAIIKPIIVLIIMLILFHFLFNYFTSRIMQTEKTIKNILNMQDSFVVLTNGAKMVEANKTLLQFFGYEHLNHFIKEHSCICDYFIPANGFLKQDMDGIRWNKHILKNPKEIHKVKMLNLKKEERIFVIKLVDLKNSNENKYVITLTDITNIEKKSAELEIAKVNAELANRTKSEFLANMSHEIRTPLNAILGFISILKENEKDKEKVKYLNTIDSCSQSLLGIINDILDFSKIESGKMAIDKIDFNTQEEFKTLSKLFFARAKEKDINFDISIDDNLPKVLYGDILRIKQITVNLLSNAIKFTDKGKFISLKIRHKDNKLYVSVKDSGIGISKDKQANIFKAFSQAESSTTRKYGGTGLGLAICSNLVQLLEGELELKSEINKGSEFSFWIPAREGREKKRENEKIPNNTTFEAKVLLVEDNKSNQMLMKLLFKKFGLQYEIANDGLEAVEIFNKEKFDLILMDENMPNLNGIEATKKILKIEKIENLSHTPIVALTANAIKGDRERFLEAGMDEYLSKPIDKKALVKVFNKFLS